MAAAMPPPPPSIPTTTFEPSPIGGGGDLAMAAPAPAVQAAGGLERLDNVEQRLSDISRRVDLLDKSSDDVRNDISRIRDSIAQIEGDMRELTSLYDLISTQINPFIDTANMEERPAVAVEQSPVPDLDALFEPTPELSTEQGAGQPELVTVPSESARALPEESKEGGAEGIRRTPRLAKIGADASCHLALMEFGALAKTVLAVWGVRATDDWGNIVFNLIDNELMSKTNDDTRDNFHAIYDFDEAFDYRITMDEAR